MRKGWEGERKREGGGEREREGERGEGREDLHVKRNFCASKVCKDVFIFRRLLFLSIDDILGDEAVVSGDPLPHSYVLNFLFSRAPSEMRSPHQVIKSVNNNMYKSNIISYKCTYMTLYM
jgi:hypothetical protein